MIRCDYNLAKKHFQAQSVKSKGLRTSPTLSPDGLLASFYLIGFSHGRHSILQSKSATACQDLIASWPGFRSRHGIGAPGSRYRVAGCLGAASFDGHGTPVLRHGDCPLCSDCTDSLSAAGLESWAIDTCPCDDHGVYCHTEDVGAAAPPTLSSASNPSGSKVPLLAKRVTVAILAQGTSWAVAVTQAFLLPGSIPGMHI